MRIKLGKKVLLWGLIVLTGSGMGLVSVMLWLSGPPAERVSQVEIVDDGQSYRDEEGQLYVTGETRDRIAQLHQRYNQLVGWGEYQRFNHPDNWDNVSFQADIEELEQLSEMSAGVLQQDFENMARLVAYAVHEKDVEALLYAHRVIHDLDVIINGYDEQIFGYTHTGHDSDKVDVFLMEYGENVESTTE
ncbi:hypothetical protein J2S00_003541 [Caldalkalibacillus uzonensis]|uniref:Uncharacterized protein n=1 Tax=Caldalkalibacillus uzonensis TaxID=353224 RepID=A0ABU0CWF6_9BACI|nr:hypothetical protein [Caldalkalibacillus uzonensis]MDQ0340715.1 hypothetical protein [Caldalkalibacillus uzonensis]